MFTEEEAKKVVAYLTMFFGFYLYSVVLDENKALTTWQVLVSQADGTVVQEIWEKKKLHWFLKARLGLGSEGAQAAMKTIGI